MRRIREYAPAIIGIASLLLSACGEDMAQREPSFVPAPDAIQAYFPPTNRASHEVLPSDTSVTLTVARVHADAAVTVGLSALDPNGVFTIPTAVFFDVGQTEAEISIRFAALPIFENFMAEITIDPEHTNPYLAAEGTTSFVLNVMLTDWVDHAMGLYYADYLLEEWQQVLQYSDTLDLYRFPNLFAEGYHYTFGWDGGRAIAPGGVVNQAGFFVVETGIVNDTLGMISTQTDPSPHYTYWDEETQTFYFDKIWPVSREAGEWFTDAYTVEEFF